MTLTAYELNIDGLIGPTHHFGGLSGDNVASKKSRHTLSKPKEAALQGLYKMRMLADMGIKQAVLPPQERPDVHLLRQLGFSGTNPQLIEACYKSAPELLVALSSSAFAWAANAATISPSADTSDGRVHITPANKPALFHRSLESDQMTLALYALFPHPEAFVHHDPLPCHPDLGDEGSANWIRLCKEHGGPGVELFVYGREMGERTDARQSLQASHAIARLHRLDKERTVFIRQNPELIDSGVFHNDLAAVGHLNTLIVYEKAWDRQQAVLDELHKKVEHVSSCPLEVITITEEEMPIPELITSYLLNSQLVSLPDNSMVLIAPTESRENRHAQQAIERILDAANTIEKVLYFDLSESMKNGGGPACLRLRASLTSSEFEAFHRPALLNDVLYHALIEWVQRHYREELLLEDLGDPSLLLESYSALDELTEILDLGPLYPFQQ